MASKDLHFSIDEGLQLKPVNRIPHGAQRCPMPERAIDTVLLRNLHAVSRALFREPGFFLFNSLHYWGSFDVGCILSSGRVVCIESKRRRASLADFRKFLRDVRQVHEEGSLYLAHRWQHHVDYWEDYRDTSLRMFAAFFLKLRCETQSPRADLLGRAARKLGVAVGKLRELHDASNDWLDRLRDKAWHGGCCSGLWEFLKENELELKAEPPTWVLLAPDTDPEQLDAWRSENRRPLRQRARLVNYAFWQHDREYPTFLSMRNVASFTV